VMVSTEVVMVISLGVAWMCGRGVLQLDVSDHAGPTW
jgi:hypothetical protein